MAEFVDTAVADGVATITIDRAERHNSLVPALLEELISAIDALDEGGVHDADDAVRAVVLETAGPSFSTGGDVQGFYDNRDDLASYAERTVGGLNDVVLALRDLDVPVVAAVDGPVTGGSLGLVLASDGVFAGPDATITPYYVAVGVSPDGGWTAMLPDGIGRARTTAIIVRNETIQPAQAVEWGIASRLVEGEGTVEGDRGEGVRDQGVREAARATAREIATMKRGSVEATKRLLAGDRETLSDRLAAERRAFVAQVQTDEALEGMRAFLE
jgi:2-(1,2-epoxy-1,2-dihydrophenyl)acetyl-CoA isomerase